jgi:hypothetical protein
MTLHPSWAAAKSSSPRENCVSTFARGTLRTSCSLVIATLNAAVASSLPLSERHRSGWRANKCRRRAVASDDVARSPRSASTRGCSLLHSIASQRASTRSASQSRARIAADAVSSSRGGGVRRGGGVGCSAGAKRVGPCMSTRARRGSSRSSSHREPPSSKMTRYCVSPPARRRSRVTARMRLHTPHCNLTVGARSCMQ